MPNELKTKQTAEDISFGNALNSFSVDVMIKHLKHWNKKVWKKYKYLPYREQKRILCQAIIDNEKVLDTELVKKAKAYIKKLEEIVNVKRSGNNQKK